MLGFITCSHGVVVKEFVFVGKAYTPNLNEFVRSLLRDGPDLDQQTLMTILAIMDELLQDVISHQNTNDEITDAVLATYQSIEEYFELDNIGH